MTSRSIIAPRNVGRILAVMAVVLPAAASVQAQTPIPSPPPASLKLVWDHSGVNVDKFLLCVDALPCTDIGLPLLTDQTPALPSDKVYGVAFPALAPGVHSIIAKTSFQGAEQPAPAFPATLVLVEAPKHLRVKAP